MKLRCFVSIDMPKKIQFKIENIQDCLPEFKGKKTELGNLHLTLKFLGEVDKSVLENIKLKLREIKFKKFKIKLGHLGFFGNKKYGVVWVYLANCENLQKLIDEKLKAFFKLEYRFMSHLTIARVKKLNNEKEFLNELRKINFEKTEFEVKSFKLKSSVLKDKGPFYETLEEYGLI